MKKKYIWYLVFAIFCLVVPTAVYLCFLIPNMKEEYIMLMSSGGVIGGAGFYGANAIPDKVKFSSLFKTSARSFTVLTITVLVEKFINQLIGLAVTIILSYIVYKILMEVYRDRKRKQQSTELAQEIARSIDATTK